QEPDVAAVVAEESPHDDVVIVPLLLSRGHHTEVDIARVTAGRDDVRRARPLGPHPLVAQVLATRLRASVGGCWQPGDHVVLAAAGSTNSAAREDVEAAALNLRRLVPAPVSIGYASATSPRIDEAVAAARAAGATRVIAASHV